MKIKKYEDEIYKIAKTESMAINLSQKALGKTTKTKSVTDNILNKYQRKQNKAMTEINGMENLLKHQASQIKNSTKNSTKINQTLM